MICPLMSHNGEPNAKCTEACSWNMEYVNDGDDDDTYRMCAMVAMAVKLETT